VVGPTRLEARNFLRIAPVRRGINETISTVNDDSPPLVSVEPTSSSIEFFLDLRTPATRALVPEDTHIDVSWSQGGDSFSLELRRRSVDISLLSDPLEDYESYWLDTGYQEDDYDVDEMLGSQPLPSPVGDLVIVLYVITYGIDGTDFNAYYSEPVRLEPAIIVTG
jgi:hypothetical protein